MSLTPLSGSLSLGMPLGNERFAETICARLGVRRNSGKRGRPVREDAAAQSAVIEQQELEL